MLLKKLKLSIFKCIVSDLSRTFKVVCMFCIVVSHVIDGVCYSERFWCCACKCNVWCKCGVMSKKRL